MMRGQLHFTIAVFTCFVEERSPTHRTECRSGYSRETVNVTQLEEAYDLQVQLGSTLRISPRLACGGEGIMQGWLEPRLKESSEQEIERAGERYATNQPTSWALKRRRRLTAPVTRAPAPWMDPVSRGCLLPGAPLRGHALMTSRGLQSTHEHTITLGCVKGVEVEISKFCGHYLYG